MTRRKTVNLPPSFMSKDLEILVSHYGHPHRVEVVHQCHPRVIDQPWRGAGWFVVCKWADREKTLHVGSREEADIVAASVKSDFMP